MTDRLPPLTALRAFDAAARHMSFARAAAELHVTPAALSLQIKSLEEHLGAPLFRRLNRAVELTEAGRALQPGLAEGFAALGAAWRSARRRTDQRTLTVTAGPGFTAKWLAPRMFGFARRYPGIELRFSASLRLMDFQRDEIDCAVRFAVVVDPGLHAEPLLDDEMTPMMTPGLAARYPTAESLAGAPLLHQDDLGFLTPRIDWDAWFAAAGLDARPETGARFSQADHAIDAALSGAGVVLGRRSLAHDALATGQLVAPFGLTLELPARYWFVCLPQARTRPQVQAFRDWLHEEVAAMRAGVTGGLAPADPLR